MPIKQGQTHFEYLPTRTPKNASGEISVTTLYKEFLIPPAVHREIQVGVQKGLAHSLAIVTIIEAGHIQVSSVHSEEIKFERPINLGEVEAIRLALQEKVVLVLVDDRDARVEAERLGLQVKGTVGILLAATRQNLISESEGIEYLETIRARPDIWIGQDIIQAAIASIQKRRN
jgi:predicted nucleic acid-binding protein